MMQKMQDLLKIKQVKVALIALAVIAVLSIAFFAGSVPARSDLPLDGTDISTTAPTTQPTSETTEPQTEPVTMPTESTPANTPPQITLTEPAQEAYIPAPPPQNQPVSPPVAPPRAPVTPPPTPQPTVTISIRCDTILNNLHLFDQNKLSILPADGIILTTTTVSFTKGESVFDVLRRITRDRRIHLDFTLVPAFNNAYIRGIHNIYEFDAGPLSGWMFRVNGELQTVGSSAVILRDGDIIEWLYTVDLGRDLGGGW